MLNDSCCYGPKLYSFICGFYSSFKADFVAQIFLYIYVYIYIHISYVYQNQLACQVVNFINKVVRARKKKKKVFHGKKLVVVVGGVRLTRETNLFTFPVSSIPIHINLFEFTLPLIPPTIMDHSGHLKISTSRVTCTFSPYFL